MGGGGGGGGGLGRHGARRRGLRLHRCARDQDGGDGDGGVRELRCTCAAVCSRFARSLLAQVAARTQVALLDLLGPWPPARLARDIYGAPWTDLSRVARK